MSDNPFDPPKAHVEDVDAPGKPPVYTIAALLAMQLLCFAFYFPIQFELVRTGAIALVGPFLALVADVLLLLGVVVLLVKGAGKTLFLLSAIGFAVATTLVWSRLPIPMLTQSIYTFGTLIALYAWWATRAYSIALQKFQSITSAG